MTELKQPKAIEPNKIYAYDVDGVVYVIQHLRNIYGFKPILRWVRFFGIFELPFAGSHKERSGRPPESA